MMMTMIMTIKMRGIMLGWGIEGPPYVNTNNKFSEKGDSRQIPARKMNHLWKFLPSFPSPQPHFYFVSQKSQRQADWTKG